MDTEKAIDYLEWNQTFAGRRKSSGVGYHEVFGDKFVVIRNKNFSSRQPNTGCEYSCQVFVFDSSGEVVLKSEEYVWRHRKHHSLDRKRNRLLEIEDFLEEEKTVIVSTPEGQRPISVYLPEQIE